MYLNDTSYIRLHKNPRRTKKLFHLQAQRFSLRSMAKAALDQMALTLRYHHLTDPSLTRHDRYPTRGRPKQQASSASVQWSIQAQFKVNQEALSAERQQKACFILGTNIPSADLTDQEVFMAYKKQSSVERGFRFLKDPLFFVSSLFRFIAGCCGICPVKPVLPHQEG